MTSSGRYSGLEPAPVVKTERLIKNFEQHYSSFLGGFLADHGSVHPAAMSGATLKTYTANSPRRQMADVDYESNYRPSLARTMRASSAASSWRASTDDKSSRGDDTSEGTVTQNSAADVVRRGTVSKLKLSMLAPPSPGDRARNKKQEEHSKDYAKEPLDMDPQVSAQEEAEAKRREACESMRMLVFGVIGHERLEEKHKASIFQQRRGSHEEVAALCDCWSQLDSDNSGDVDLDEFVSYFNKRKVDRLLGMRCVRYLMPKIQQGGSGSVTKEDMMRLIWLEARDEDIQHMNNVFDYFRLQKLAVQPPKLLQRKRRLELLDCFHELDRDRTGSVPYIDLLEIGIADHSMIQTLRDKHDKNRKGSFDRDEFLEILAPLGYRAHPDVKQAVCKDGRRMRFVTWSPQKDFHFEGWLLEEDYDMLQEHYGFEKLE